MADSLSENRVVYRQVINTTFRMPIYPMLNQWNAYPNQIKSNQTKFIYTPHISKTIQGCLQCKKNNFVKKVQKQLQLFTSLYKV